MNITKAIKILAAVLLLVSIAFPMSSCTVTEEPDTIQESASPETITHSGETEFIYLLDHFDAGDPSTWVTLFVFTWPVWVLIILHLKRSGRVATATRLLEPALLIGSVIWVDFLSTFFADRRELGAYLAFSALGLYAIGTIWADLQIYRKWKNERGT